MRKLTEASVYLEYRRGLDYKRELGLFDTVRNNENFFVGKQWEGVRSNGLPTPVFNFLKRAVLFTVAGLTSSSAKITASALGTAPDGAVAAVNSELDAIFETNSLHALIRELLRNSAVDGDGCLFVRWDADRPNGAGRQGAVTTEVVENSRVFFGNVNSRHVQEQPYIIVSHRVMIGDARETALQNGADPALVLPDSDAELLPRELREDDARVTVLMRLWKDAQTRTVWCCESAKGVMLRSPWDTGLALYPLIWLPWDYIRNSYHGQAMITGLIPNQVFVNKLFAMSMISLMTTAYPKVVYDRARIAKWDNRVGAAIPVLGGDVTGAARIIDPAHVSPQIAQFIDAAISYTQTFLGATPAALGEVRPDNTSAIIALQKASAVPNELTRANLYQALEDLGRIYIDFMRAYYGERAFGDKHFDFERLGGFELSLKLDVGASAYWSELASMNTLDNLLVRGKISFEDYLERVPDGYIPAKRELLEKIKSPASL
ncbi:MAG: hypothetical protein LBN99_01150 [Oscillospiraceae bacterium]|jgi:hypothetical protein|nr:hypothetical protein [Oscillospiraceae bacterium]